MDIKRLEKLRWNARSSDFQAAMELLRRDAEEAMQITLVLGSQ